jgi:outer membrane protein insertion porin family
MMPAPLALLALAAAFDLACPERPGLVAALPEPPGAGVYRVGRIHFAGNVRTCDRLLREQMLLAEGDVLNTRLLEQSLQRLAGLGHLELKGPVRLVPALDDDHRLDLTIGIEERSRPLLGLGGTLGGVEGGSLAGSLASRNLLGCGEGLELELQGGERFQRYRAAFDKPYLLGAPLAVGVEVEKRRLDFQGSEADGIDAFLDERTGARLALRPSAWGRTRLSTHYSYASILTEPRGRVAPSRPELFGRRHESELAAGFVRDTLGRCWRPRSGTRLGASLALVGGPLGGDLDVVEGRLEAVAYRSTTTRTSVGVRLQAAGLRRFGGSTGNVIPFDRRYALGGPSEVRGYRPREIGPRDAAGRVEGGDKRLLLNVEYALDLGDRVRALAFLDAGNAFREDRALDPTRLLASTGAELRVRVPVLYVPLRLIYAVRLPVDTLGRSSDFAVALGTMFGP